MQKAVCRGRLFPRNRHLREDFASVNLVFGEPVAPFPLGRLFASFTLSCSFFMISLHANHACLFLSLSLSLVYLAHIDGDGSMKGLRKKRTCLAGQPSPHVSTWVSLQIPTLTLSCN